MSTPRLNPARQVKDLIAQGAPIPPDLQRQAFQQAGADGISTEQMAEFFGVPPAMITQSATDLGIIDQLPVNLGGSVPMPGEGVMRDMMYRGPQGGFSEGPQPRADSRPQPPMQPQPQPQPERQYGGQMTTGQESMIMDAPAPNPLAGIAVDNDYSQAEIDQVRGMVESGALSIDQVAQNFGVTPNYAAAGLGMSTEGMDIQNINNQSAQEVMRSIEPNGNYTAEQVETITDLMNAGQLNVSDVAEHFKVDDNFVMEVITEIPKSVYESGSFTPEQTAKLESLITAGVATAPQVATYFDAPVSDVTDYLKNSAGYSQDQVIDSMLTNVAADASYNMQDAARVKSQIDAGNVSVADAAKQFNVSEADINRVMDEMNDTGGTGGDSGGDGAVVSDGSGSTNISPGATLNNQADITYGRVGDDIPTGLTGSETALTGSSSDALNLLNNMNTAGREDLTGQFDAGLANLLAGSTQATNDINSGVTSGINALNTGINTARSDLTNAGTTARGDITAAGTTARGDITAGATTATNAFNAAADTARGDISAATTDAQNRLNQGIATGRQDLSSSLNTAQGQLAAGINQGRGDISTSAQDALSSLNTGLNRARGDLSAGIAQGRSDLTQGNNLAINELGLARNLGSSQIRQGTEQGLGAFNQGIGQARGDIAGSFGRAEQSFNPYQQAGTNALQMQQALSGALGQDAFNQAFNESPQMQFLREQGERAAMRGAAAGGGSGGGNILKELSRFNQGLASTELQNQIGNLSNLSSQGLNATGSAAGIATSGGQNLANLAQQQGSTNLQALQAQGQNLANITGQTGQSIAGMQQAQGQGLANLATSGSQQLANLGQLQGTAGADIAQNRGQNLANLAQSLGTQSAGMTQSTGAGLANMAQTQGTQGANIAQSQGQNLANIAQSRGQNLANVAQSQGQSLANVAQSQGQNLANIAQSQGQGLSNLAEGQGMAGLQTYLNQGQNLASISENLGTNQFNARMNLGGALSGYGLSTGLPAVSTISNLGTNLAAGRTRAGELIGAQAYNAASALGGIQNDMGMNMGNLTQAQMNYLNNLRGQAGAGEASAQTGYYGNLANNIQNTGNSIMGVPNGTNYIPDYGGQIGNALQAGSAGYYMQNGNQQGGGAPVSNSQPVYQNPAYNYNYGGNQSYPGFNSGGQQSNVFLGR